MFLKIVKLFFIFILLLSSCKSKKEIATNSKIERPKNEQVTLKKERKEKEKVSTTKLIPIPKHASYKEIVTIYIKNYSDIAKEEMVKYGIPASITLAQGILESGAGRAELSKKSNNHFGIKCHREWAGEIVYHDDDELQECFRKYKDPKYSFRDHSLFLTQRSRYQDLFNLKKDDYKSWARGLKKAGYATDPKYSNKLITIIEKYNLDTFDNEVLRKKTKRNKKRNTSNTKTYVVKKGDTLYQIAVRFNITVESIKEHNGLESDFIVIGQELYLNLIK